MSSTDLTKFVFMIICLKVSGSVAGDTRMNIIRRFLQDAISMDVSQLQKTYYYVNIQNPIQSGLPNLKLCTIDIFMSFTVGNY